jgi:hypothetical protein
VLKGVGVLCRAGCSNWAEAVCSALAAGNDENFVCIEYIMEIYDDALSFDDDVILKAAISRGDSESLKFLYENRFEFHPYDLCYAADAQNSEGLRFLLDVDFQVEPKCWDNVMAAAIQGGSIACIKALYESGYEELRFRAPGDYGPHKVIWWSETMKQCRLKTLACLVYVLDRSGHPFPKELPDCAAALNGGVETLRYVRELGCVFNELTTAYAALEGDLEALRYLHSCGAPWNIWTLEASVYSGSLECLEYAHSNGCPQDPPDAQESQAFAGFVPEEYFEAVADDVEVLRYVCERMTFGWAQIVLTDTIRAYSDENISAYLPEEHLLVIMYLERQLGKFGLNALAEPLAEVVAAQKKRAAAMAGVFWKAGKLRQQSQEQMAQWTPMAETPNDVVRIIAGHAELVLP